MGGSSKAPEEWVEHVRDAFELFLLLMRSRRTTVVTGALAHVAVRARARWAEDERSLGAQDPKYEGL